MASFAVSGWLTSTLGQMAGAAGRIAAGEFDQRVSYSADDEVGELARSFNDMAGRLEQTEQVRRELLGTISHELRTPLTNIQGYMEGLIDGVVPEEPETYQLVHREAARLSRLVADIERLSRVEAGVERIEPRRLSTGRVVGDTVERLRPQFEQKPLSLSLEIAEEVPDVWADEDKVVQVLTNVVGNSFKYTAGRWPRDGARAVDGRRGGQRRRRPWAVRWEDHGAVRGERRRHRHPRRRPAPHLRAVLSGGQVALGARRRGRYRPRGRTRAWWTRWGVPSAPRALWVRARSSGSMLPAATGSD